MSGTASDTTVVFADLTGSTAAFESLGNERATRTITELTTWIAKVCERHRGRVVKTLGDGVLAVFDQTRNAVQAVVQLQNVHLLRLDRSAAGMSMHLKVGVACGEVVVVNGDCYGDAVNVASRLADLSGADQVWVNDAVASQFKDDDDGIHFISLGPIQLRGRAEPCGVHRVEWRNESQVGALTVPAGLEQLSRAMLTTEGSIELTWLNQTARFGAARLPIHVGRAVDAQFVVKDQRVSRVHASISRRSGVFVLADMSSFGTWIRFDGSQTELPLRREECVLHDNGVMALGAPFSDFSAVTVSFNLTGGHGSR